MSFTELCQNSLAKLYSQKKLLVLSLAPFLLLGALFHNLSEKYLAPILQFYGAIQQATKLDLQFLEQLNDFKALLQGSYWSYFLAVVLILLLFCLIHTLNIYELLTLNATEHSAGSKQIIRATLFYSPKLLLGVVFKYLLLYLLGILFSWWAWPVWLNLSVLLFLVFLLRFSNTLQVLDLPFWKAYYLSLRSNLLEPAANLLSLFLYFVIFLGLLSGLGITIEVFLFFNYTSSLFLLATLVLITVCSYLLLLSADIYLFLHIYQSNKQRLL